MGNNSLEEGERGAFLRRPSSNLAFFMRALTVLRDSDPEIRGRFSSLLVSTARRYVPAFGKQARSFQKRVVRRSSFHPPLPPSRAVRARGRLPERFKIHLERHTYRQTAFMLLGRVCREIIRTQAQPSEL